MKMETPVERKVPPSSYEYTAAAGRAIRQSNAMIPWVTQLATSSPNPSLYISRMDFSSMNASPPMKLLPIVAQLYKKLNEGCRRNIYLALI